MQTSAEAESLLVSLIVRNICELRNVLTRGFVLGGLTIRLQDEVVRNNSRNGPNVYGGEPDEKNIYKVTEKHSENRSAIAKLGAKNNVTVQVKTFGIGGNRLVDKTN